MTALPQRNRPTLLLLAIVLLIAGGGASADRPLTAAIHCDLTYRLLTLSAAEWTDRIAAAEANRGDDESLRRALDTIAARQNALRSTVYAEYQTSAEAAGRFGSDRRQAIRDYLDEHAEVAAELQAARERVHRLIDRFESLMKAARREKK